MPRTGYGPYDSSVGLGKAFPIQDAVLGRGRIPPPAPLVWTGQPAHGVPATTPSPRAACAPYGVRARSWPAGLAPGHDRSRPGASGGASAYDPATAMLPPSRRMTWSTSKPEPVAWLGCTRKRRLIWSLASRQDQRWIARWSLMDLGGAELIFEKEDERIAESRCRRH